MTGLLTRPLVPPQMPSKSSETPDVEIILQSGCPAAVELQEEEEEEIEVDGKAA